MQKKVVELNDSCIGGLKNLAIFDHFFATETWDSFGGVWDVRKSKSWKFGLLLVLILVLW